MNRHRGTVWGLVLLLLLAGCSITGGSVSAPLSGNLLKNASFEEASGPMPDGWQFENKAAGKGTAAVAGGQVHEGKLGLKLSPNERNSPAGIANSPLGVGQGFPAGNFLGRKLYLAGWMSAEGGAKAVMGVYALRKNGSVHFVELRQDTSPSLTYQQDSIEIPRDSNFMFLIVNCHVEGRSGSAYFDGLYVGFDQPPTPRAAATITPAAELSAQLRIDAGKQTKRISRGVFGTNVEWIWNGNGLWDESAGRLDDRYVSLVADLGTAQIRFPGGIFAGFYNWRDGIGPQSARKTNDAMPGGPRSRHNFGTDEALELSRRTGAPLFITANISTGSPQDAVDWLTYLRERTGSGKAPPVRYWEIGNEQYVNDGSAHARASTLTPAEYVTKYRQFSNALRRADSNVLLGAILDENYGATIPHAYPQWTEEVLKGVSGSVDFVSVHNGYAPAVINPAGRSPREIYSAMLAAPLLIEKSLAGLDRKLQSIAGDRTGRIKIAVTEWGPFFHLAPDSPYVDHVKTLGSALYVASVLKVFLAAARVDLAHFFKLGDELFMGWIGKRAGQWVPKAPYLAFQLISRNTGDAVVASSCVGPTYASRAVGWVDAMPKVPYVDTLATVSSDGKKLFVLAINKHFDKDIPLDVQIDNAKLTGRARISTLTGTGIDANTGTELFRAPGVKWAAQAKDDRNPQFDRGGDGQVRISSQQRQGLGPIFKQVLPKASVTAMELDIR